MRHSNRGQTNVTRFSDTLVPHTKLFFGTLIFSPDWGRGLQNLIYADKKWGWMYKNEPEEDESFGRINNRIYKQKSLRK